MRGSVGVPWVPEAKGSLSRCRAGGTGQGAGGRGCIWSTGLRELELRGFQAAAGCSTVTEGVTPWKGGRPGPTAPSSANATFPGLSPGWSLGELFPEPPPAHPPALCIPRSFSSPFPPFLPQSHKRKFLLPSEHWQGPLSPTVRGRPASMPSWLVRRWQLLSV